MSTVFIVVPLSDCSVEGSSCHSVDKDAYVVG